MNEEPRDAPGEEDLAELRGGIEQTRSEMAETLQALEQKLDPADLRDKAAAELVQVEQHVKAAVQEQLHEVRIVVKEELKEAKDALAELMVTAKDTLLKDAKDAAGEIIVQAKEAVKDDVIAIKDSMKGDLSDALTSARMAARAATLGKLEDLATEAGDAMTTARDTLADTIRQNPLPAALAGIGIAWLLMNRSAKASGRRDGAYESGSPHRAPDIFSAKSSAAGETAALGQPSISGVAQEAREKAGALAHGASEAAENALSAVAETAKSAASSATEGASHLAGEARQRGDNLVRGASDLARRAGDSAGRVARAMPRQARRVEELAQRKFVDNPLALGATALAVGAVVGLTLPHSRREDELLGGTRDRLLHGAQEVAHDATMAVRNLGEKADKVLQSERSSSRG